MPTMIDSIKSALKSKAPIVAVPVEGRAPVCLPSKLLKGALKGVEILSVEANDSTSFNSTDIQPARGSAVRDGRYVTVKGRAPASWSEARIATFKAIHGRKPSQDEIGYIRTSCRVFAVPRKQAIEANREWAEKERAKRERESLQGALSTKARAQAKKDAKRAKLENELLAEANQARDAAKRRVKRAVSVAIPTPAKITKDGETVRHDTSFSDYAEDLRLWRASKRERANVGRIGRELSKIRARIYEITGRKSEREFKHTPGRRREGQHVTVWKGRKRKLRGAVVSELIALVRRAVELEAAHTRAVESLPLRPRFANYGEGLARLTSSERPKVTYAYWAAGHPPVYAPARSDEFARRKWETERKERARELAEAQRVLRDIPEAVPEEIAA